MIRNEDGYTSVGVLIIVLFLSSLALGILYFSRTAAKQYSKIEAIYTNQLVMEDAVKELIDQLGKDPTPDADSPHDPVWTWLSNRAEDEVSLTLEDISSRFNLNFVRTKMLEFSVFSSMMINGKSSEDLKLYRGEQGFSNELLTHYSEFFTEEDLLGSFTTYSYANLNVTYEDSLKQLYEARVPEGSSQIFLSKVQQLISEMIMADEAKMKSLMGTDFDSLYPVINIEPLMNVNFIPEKVLNAVLHYPYGEEKLDRAADLEEIILAERTNLEIDLSRLKSLYEFEDHYLRIPQYLGTRTWFWSISATKGNNILEVIICRLPSENEDEPVFKVIEWKFKS